MVAIQHLRTLTALLALILAARYAYIEGLNWWTSFASVSDAYLSQRERTLPEGPLDTAHSDLTATSDPLAMMQELQKSSELDLKKLNEQTTGNLEGTAPPAPMMTIRRILVDLGPERSEVYINGRHVGKTPYGGQVNCLDDAILSIVVLPTKGPPIKRSVRCIGMHIEASTE